MDSKLLSGKPADLFAGFLDDCRALGYDAESIGRDALQSVRYYAGGEEPRSSLELKAAWDEGLRTGQPDYSVYGDGRYLSELWACWATYSRKYLRDIARPSCYPPHGMMRELGEVQLVVDVGCGIGWTTAALSQMFSGAEVVGTNLEGTMQMRFARRMGERHGFEVVGEAPMGEEADMVFASEYFEHILDPVTHLEELVAACRPKSIIMANAFGTEAIGHFDWYQVKGARVAAKGVGKLFHARLRQLGYENIKTKMWNGRPAWWRRAKTDARPTGLGLFS